MSETTLSHQLVGVGMKEKLLRPRRSNADRAAETKSSIMESTISTLCDAGYSKTTFQEISSRSGVSLGAIQHHYQNKDVLILSTLEVLFDDLQDAITKLDDVTGDSDTKCRSFIDIMWYEYYNRDIYIAVWEIIVGCRSDSELYNMVKLHRANSTIVVYKAWQQLMQVDENHGSLVALDLSLKFMRSASYMNLGVSPEDYTSKQLDILSKLLSEFDY